MASLNIVTAYIDLLGKSRELSVVRERDSKVNKKPTKLTKNPKGLQIKTQLLKLYTLSQLISPR